MCQERAVPGEMSPMAFDWNGYLQIARDCVAQPEDEGLLRTAISRAYYAAYHAAKSYVEQVTHL